MTVPEQPNRWRMTPACRGGSHAFCLQVAEACECACHRPAAPSEPPAEAQQDDEFCPRTDDDWMPRDSVHMAPHPDDWPSADTETLRRVRELADELDRLGEHYDGTVLKASTAFHSSAALLRAALGGTR